MVSSELVRASDPPRGQTKRGLRLSFFVELGVERRRSLKNEAWLWPRFGVML